MDPVARLAVASREYGEYGGVNPSIEISTTFTGEQQPPNRPSQSLLVQSSAPIIGQLASMIP